MSADRLAELSDIEIAGPSGVVALECQADELAAEQADLYQAAGTKAARQAHVNAAGHQFPARAAEAITSHLAGLLALTVANATTARQALNTYTQRPSSAKAWYLAGLVILLAGDMAAGSGGYIMLGEIPALAISLAAATGAAAVIGGKIGAETKHNKPRRERRINQDELPAHLASFQHLFLGDVAGKASVRLMATVSGGIIVALTISIIALRTGLDGKLAGAAFGLAALAISLGSVINAYVYADDIADILDAMDKAVTKAQRKYQRAAGAPVISNWWRAVTEAGSIMAEHTALASAAGHQVKATMNSVLVRTPDFATATDEAPDTGISTTDTDEATVGRRMRAWPLFQPVPHNASETTAASNGTGNGTVDLASLVEVS